MEPRDPRHSQGIPRYPLEARGVSEAHWRPGGSMRPMEPRDPHLGDPRHALEARDPTWGSQVTPPGNPGTHLQKFISFNRKYRLMGSPRPMEPRDPHLGDPRHPLEARDPT